MSDGGEMQPVEMPELRTLVADTVLTKREGDEVAICMPLSYEIDGFNGISYEFSPAGARQFAAALLNLADVIEGV